MTVPLLAWYPLAAPLPDIPLVPDLALGAWLVVALLASLLGLLWSLARPRDVSTRLLRRTRPRRRAVGRQHAAPGRP